MSIMPSVFISYSWDSEKHKSWVLDLATQLRFGGVEVTLDQWHTVPGDMLPEFMEKSIRKNDYILIICTPRYKEKSNSRIGGVGYEGSIITAELLTTLNQRKFIPVLRQNEWTVAAPSWLLGKYYVDLRGEKYPHQEYQKLLQTLLGNIPQAPPISRSTSQNSSQTLSKSSQISTLEQKGEKKLKEHSRMSTHQIHIFISHAWAYSEHYEKLAEWIFDERWSVGQASLNFLDYSIPKDDPIHDARNDAELKAAIYEKISRSHVIVAPCGMYASYSKWIKKEIEGSRYYSKPILGVNPWGQQKKPGVVTDNADDSVGWNKQSVITGIWNLYYRGQVA